MSEVMVTDLETNSKTAKTVSDSFVCKFCSKIFSKKHGLNRHKKVCSLNDDAKNAIVANCQICGRPFNRMDNLKKHEKNCSNSLTKNKHVKKRSCLYENCQANFYQKDALIQHLTNNHGHSFEETSQISFKSHKEFEEWKQQMEEETHSYFIKINGKKGAVQYFYCQQDGEPNKAQRKTSRRNSKGQIKTGKTCIAYIKLTENIENKSYSVIFQPMHCHLLQPRDKKQHSVLKEELNTENEEIEEIETVVVTSSYQNQNSPAADSDHIIFSYGLIEDVCQQELLKLRKLSTDEASVISIVRSYLNENDSPIILYKSSNPEVYIGPEEFVDLSVPADSFILGIQTKEQREMFISSSQVLLSLDTTHTNQDSDYQVLNIVVPDEKLYEYPVGHLITNELNSTVLALFFYSILSNCPDVTVNCIISNNDPELNKAISSVFGENLRHIFCIWRLYEDFQQHLEMFAPAELRDGMFSALEVIVNADDETTAQNCLEVFKRNYVEVAPNFIDYLSTNYENVLEKWVLCFRNFDHGDVNTVILSEAHHNKLLSFMNRKVEWNLEDFVGLLLELEEDDYLRRANEQILGVSFGLSDPQNSRHEEGHQISDSLVTFLFQKHWEVKSQTKMNKCYLITRVRDRCSAELCYNTCSQCNSLCGHLYYCTCIDKNPMCKHIHKIHSSFFQSVEETNEETETLMPSDQLEILTEGDLEINSVESSFGRDSNKNPEIVEIKNCLCKLSHLLTEKDLSLTFLKHVDKTLQELVNIGETSI